MNWFYATKEKTQAGPVDQTTLEGLLRSGTISSDTLVWQQGMDAWKPYSTLFGSASSSAAGGTRCAECDQEFPPDQLIALAGRSVCATCKPVAIQKLQEGVVSFGSPVDAGELWQKVQQRGFDFTLSSVLSRSWNMVKANYWPCVGVTLLCYLIMMGAGQIPLLGLLAIFLVQSQIMAGLNWYLLKQFRGESATLNDAFAGFRRGYGQQALYMLIFFAVMMGLMLVLALPLAFTIPAISAGKSSAESMVGWIMLAMIPAALAIWYFVLCWLFTPLLILDKGLKATEAMKLSRRVVHLRFWKILGTLIVVGLICLLSLLALLIGFIFVLPIAFAVISRLYEDAFGEEGPVTAA